MNPSWKERFCRRAHSEESANCPGLIQAFCSSIGIKSDDIQQPGPASSIRDDRSTKKKTLGGQVIRCGNPFRMWHAATFQANTTSRTRVTPLLHDNFLLLPYFFPSSHALRKDMKYFRKWIIFVFVFFFTLPQRHGSNKHPGCHIGCSNLASPF